MILAGAGDDPRPYGILFLGQVRRFGKEFVGKVDVHIGLGILHPRKVDEQILRILPISSIGIAQRLAFGAFRVHDRHRSVNFQQRDFLSESGGVFDEDLGSFLTML